MRDRDGDRMQAGGHSVAVKAVSFRVPKHDRVQVGGMAMRRLSPRLSTPVSCRPCSNAADGSDVAFFRRQTMPSWRMCRLLAMTRPV